MLLKFLSTIFSAPAGWGWESELPQVPEQWLLTLLQGTGRNLGYVALAQALPLAGGGA